MKNTSRHWRDQQLSGFSSIDQTNVILEQEKIMLDFVQSIPNVRWKWQAPTSNFKTICRQKITITENDYDGIILFGNIFFDITTSQLVNIIRKQISNINFAYIGINRYWIIENDLDIELPDRIDDSIDKIMKCCDDRITRLHTFDEVDGSHMIASHPMDCYKLCK